MALLAYKIFTVGGKDYRVEHAFECGQFDLMTEQQPGHGWVEVWRDCDLMTRSRQTLIPYASGPKGMVNADIQIADTRQRHYFDQAGTDDSFTATLDLSGVNGGILPNNICAYLDLYQNGVLLPCRAYSLNPATAIITIEAEWRVPGASYTVKFWASPDGGNSSHGT